MNKILLGLLLGTVLARWMEASPGCAGSAPGNDDDYFGIFVQRLVRGVPDRTFRA